MPTTSHKRKIALTITTLLVLAGAVVLQFRYDQIVLEHYDLHAPVHQSVLPAVAVKYLSFGFDNFIADYYWVRAVQALLRWDGFDEYYPEYFRTISTLDPQFEYPYTFAILTVPRKKNPDSLLWLDRIATDGVRAIPQSWKIPFTAATAYHITGGRGNRDTLARAIHYLEIATSVPDAPEIVRRTYGIYLMKDATDYKKSRALFTTILETSDNEETKSIMKERIQLLDFVEGIERAIEEYKSKYGSYPKTVDELAGKQGFRFTVGVEALITKYKPQIDQKTGKILLW